jgi:hypothetical protein
MIINDDSRVINKLEASLADDARLIIYDLHRFIVLYKPLVLPANARLDWKVIARYKHSSLFGLVVCNEEKKFHDIKTRTFRHLWRSVAASTSS